MTLDTRTIVLALAPALIFALSACSKTEQGAQPTANSPSSAASAPDSKSSDDLARIRELMEKEEVRKVAQAAKDKRLAESQKAGNSAPVPTFGR
jgi:outer membrane protein assembly factor BamE (lipoprotein component of BamABCDE complex)